MAPTSRTLLAVVLAALAGMVLSVSPAGGQAPAGQMVLAQTVTIAPRWFDPAEAEGTLHDALVKPMPGNPQAPSLAESWSVSPDGLAYEFVLRKGARFHNGDVVTAADVLMHEKVMFAPIFELASLGGYGPRVAESGLGLIPSMAASAPYEELTLKGK
jgi:ABC-type transport system substrate-binding protein